MQTLADAVNEVGSDLGYGHLRFPNPRGDRADANGDVLEGEFGSHHLRQMRSSSLGAIICELNSGSQLSMS